MEEEDDDLYEPGDSLPTAQTQNGNGQPDAPTENPAEEEFVEEEVEDDEVCVEVSHHLFHDHIT